MLRINKVLLFYFVVGLTACGHGGAPDSSQSMPGSDRDAHGCIGSAGYSWCASTNQCERPWELAKEQGFENELSAFQEFCNN